MSKIIEGLDKAVAQQLQNIISQNPKGSAAEKILLGKFLGSDQGTYARNVLGKNHKGWIEHIASWLKKYQPRLEKEFTEVDFSDLESLAYDMYENYLAKQGQLEETNLPPRAAFNKKPKQKGSGYSKDDYEYTEFVPKGKEDKEAWAIKRTVAKQKLEKPKPKSMDTGFYKNYLSNRPVREFLDTGGGGDDDDELKRQIIEMYFEDGLRETEISRITGLSEVAVHKIIDQYERGDFTIDEGEVVSMQARKTPLVVAGSPFDWNVYDLRTNKMVANILGGDRHESPLYEIRINRNGMTPTTRMKPTYVLRAGRDNNPPYYAYELVAPEGGFGKVEKSPGQGGTTKLRPDQDDILRHVFKTLGGGKYYGYDLNLVEEGLDQYEIIEKALGAKIMEIDDAMELGFTDWDPNDSSSIVYLGNKVNKDINEFFDTGGGGDDDDELKRQVIEMYKEDGLRELEISRITGLSEVAVNNIIDQYERGDFTMDEGKVPPKAGFNPRPMKKGPGNSPDDYEYTTFIPRGKEAGEEWAIKRDVKNQKLKPKKPSELKTGFYKNYLGNRPIREEEKQNSETANEVKKFGQWACKLLKIKNPPKIHLSYNTKEAQQGHHTGKHVQGSDSVWVYAANRNLVDILRTLFHELVHWRQTELGMIKPGDSYPGSPIEAQADMLAGKYIKIYGKQHRNIFQ